MGIEGAETCYPFIALADHVGLRIALFVFWSIVDVLPRRRPVFIDRLDIF